jgi:ABC-type ATPase involved in cell division
MTFLARLRKKYGLDEPDPHFLRDDDQEKQHIDRMRGTYVLGKTGTGKTTYLLEQIVDDIRAGRGLLVIDPKGDLVTDTLRYVPYTRRKDVRLLERVQ